MPPFKMLEGMRPGPEMAEEIVEAFAADTWKAM